MLDGVVQQHGHALGLLVGHVLARHLGNRGRVAGCGGLLAVANGLAQLNLHRQAGGELGEPLSRRLLGFGLAIALAEAELACILVFDGGRVAERGPFAELVALDGRFADLVRTQLAGGAAAPAH